MMEKINDYLKYLSGKFTVKIKDLSIFKIKERHVNKIIKKKL